MTDAVGIRDQILERIGAAVSSEQLAPQPKAIHYVVMLHQPQQWDLASPFYCQLDLTPYPCDTVRGIAAALDIPPVVRPAPGLTDA